jgi:hypothetical protein
MDKVCWTSLSGNPNALHLIEKNMDKIDWWGLSKNPNALHLIEKNMDKIDWYSLSSNPNAIHILEKNMDKIKWPVFWLNPNAIHIFEKNIDKINWSWLSEHPEIFTYDYVEMRENMKNSGVADELMKVTWKPDHLLKISKKYGIAFDELMELLD